MQGNSGGGGGLLAGYIIAKNPSLIPLGAAALAVGLGIYTVADMHDAPKRIPFAEDIVATSLEKCFNAQTHPEYYKEILKKELLKVWSSDLQAFKDAKKDMTICVDPALKTFELSGEHTEMGTVYKDIYRTMGLVYTKGGQRASSFLAKPGKDQTTAIRQLLPRHNSATKLPSAHHLPRAVRC